MKDPFSTPNSRAWDTLHVSSFSVGQSIQGSIGTYRDNIHKFIVYMLLRLNFIKKFIQNKCNVHGCRRLMICLMWAQTSPIQILNARCLLQLRIFNLQHACGYQVAFELYHIYITDIILHNSYNRIHVTSMFLCMSIPETTKHKE